jgi:hypothetical protein
MLELIKCSKDGIQRVSPLLLLKLQVCGFFLSDPLFNSLSLFVRKDPLWARASLVLWVAILIAFHVHHVGEQRLHVALAKASHSLVLSAFRLLERDIVASLIAPDCTPFEGL